MVDNGILSYLNYGKRYAMVVLLESIVSDIESVKFPPIYSGYMTDFLYLCTLKSFCMAMRPLDDNKRYNILLGDCLSVLKEMESESVDCIITSPPYWGMRAYDNEESEHEIGNENQFSKYVEALTNVFSEAKRVLKKEGSFWLNLGDKYLDKS